jgi:AcrR family transcriptional regulator
MQTLEQKPGTKRPEIVRAATSLFAERGIDGTSMRDIAEAAGVREAAIYRHFAGKDELAREIFLSWYGWYCEKLQDIVSGAARTLDKLREIVRHEFSAVTEHSEAFVYFCENEARFVRSLPPGDRECPTRLNHVYQGWAGQRRRPGGKCRSACGHAERRAVRSRAHMASYGAAEKAYYAA